LDEESREKVCVPTEPSSITRDVSPDEQSKRVPYLFSPVDASVKKAVHLETLRETRRNVVQSA